MIVAATSVVNSPVTDELEELEKEFEEFERRFDAIAKDLKKSRQVITTLVLRNAHNRERLDAEEADRKHLAMLESHGIEIKSD